MNHIDDLKLLDEKLYENVMYLKYFEVRKMSLTLLGRCWESGINIYGYHNAARQADRGAADT